MKQIILVRHARAHGLEPGVEDFERRLDRRGHQEAESIAQRARELGLLPDHLISSPADRAIATARELAKALDFPLPRIRHDDRVYLAERVQLAAILRSAPAEARRVMLVGHNPGISQFAEWLTGESVGDLPTAALYAASADLERWSDLGAGAFERVHLEFPR